MGFLINYERTRSKGSGKGFLKNFRNFRLIFFQQEVGTMRTVLFFAFSAFVFTWGPALGNAGTERTQIIQLKAGWNAVFLEVQPAVSRPADVFGKLPVETVACFAPARLDAQYLRNPGDAPWRQEGWADFYRTSTIFKRNVRC
jgi:hypothetical protein